MAKIQIRGASIDKVLIKKWDIPYEIKIGDILELSLYTADGLRCHGLVRIIKIKRDDILFGDVGECV